MTDTPKKTDAPKREHLATLFVHGQYAPLFYFRDAGETHAVFEPYQGCRPRDMRRHPVHKEDFFVRDEDVPELIVCSGSRFIVKIVPPGGVKEDEQGEKGQEDNNDNIRDRPLTLEKDAKGPRLSSRGLHAQQTQQDDDDDTEERDRFTSSDDDIHDDGVTSLPQKTTTITSGNCQQHDQARTLRAVAYHGAHIESDLRRNVVSSSVSTGIQMAATTTTRDQG